MKIRRKLEIGFGIVVVMLTTMAGLSAWSLSGSRRATVSLENAFLQQMELMRLRAVVSRQMKELGEYVIIGNEDALAEFRRSVQEATSTFDEWKHLIGDSLDHLGGTHQGEELRELEVLDYCKAKYLNLVTACSQVIELAQSGNNEEAIGLLRQHVEIIYEEGLRQAIEGQLLDEQSETTESHESMWALYQSARTLTVTLAILALVGASVASRIVTGMIAKPLARLREAAARIGKGDLEMEVDVSARDEIGELAATLNQMARDLKQTTTSIDRLQHEVQQRKKAECDLKAINEELTHFAYVVSHDLKAPLRGIKLLTEWLCTDYADQLDDDAQENLALLQNRVRRMHNLIEGVLQYSRVGRIHEHQMQVDLNAVLASIIDTIAPPDHIAITVEGTLPTVTAEKTRLVQVFQNLLTNAVKSMDKAEGRIAISHADLGDVWQFSVTDNGPGIEECHFERIFKIFQTLTSRDEFESTGVGLTLVKRIIELYGGRVWLESELGQSTTFYFTIPKHIEASRGDAPDEDWIPDGQYLQVAVTGALE